jgi:sugar O-acyltransferase (sialic acid O-acetyltransferase NeuD family)
MKKRLVIVGAGEFGSIAKHYFSKYSSSEVVAFSAEDAYITSPLVDGLPVIPFEELTVRFPPTDFLLFIAVTYTKLNRIRSRLFESSKKVGYEMASFVSPFAYLDSEVLVKENTFIFEHNVIQRGAMIGSNVILWSGNHVGHRAKIQNNCYISSHVTISGYTQIGENCFLGVNSCFGDGLVVGDDCFINMGTVVTKNCDSDSIYSGNPAVKSKVTASRFFRLPQVRRP